MSDFDIETAPTKTPGPDPAKAFLEALSSVIPGFGGKPITGDEVEFHDGPKIVLPRGMTYDRARNVLTKLEEEAEMETSWTHRFKYRPDDGAHATVQVIKERYGMLLGKQQGNFSGAEPAETRNIAVGVGQMMQVPWGQVEIPTFEGLVLTFCDEHQDRDYGKIFEIHATGPRKYEAELEAFFAAVEDYLKTKSIYRGKAIVGSANPEFLDLATFRPDQIVFSTEVMHVLEGSIWAPIRYTDAMRKEGVPLKRAALLFGPYGTGKTSAGQLTALEATKAGWTFISARPGRDKIEDVLRTARLYQPAVVFVEDIDNATSSGEDDQVTKLLEAFDGITSKGGELMVVMTTNHIERIHKGMLRPGRLDAVVEISSLDHAGIEKLIKAVVPDSKLADAIDYTQIGEAMDGFFPAFVRESITRAVTFAINRLDGELNYVIDTPDLVGAAESLRPQLEALNEAGEGVRKPDLDTAFGSMVRGEVSKLGIEYDARTKWAISEIAPVEA